MNHWLTQIPKPLLVVGILALGTLFIIFADPPHTICDTQIENFKESQKSFIFDEGEDAKKKNARIKLFKDLCITTNTVGGCLEYFHGLRRILKQVEQLSNECRPQVFNIKEVKDHIQMGAKMLVKLAWGEKKPKDIHDKYGWLEPFDMNLFCKIKDQLTQNSTKEQWDALKIKLLEGLPETEGLTPLEVLRLSILSDNCTRFR